MNFKKGSHLRDQLSLHFIVFIWGFTAILGRYISVDAPLSDHHYSIRFGLDACILRE